MSPVSSAPPRCSSPRRQSKAEATPNFSRDGSLVEEIVDVLSELRLTPDKISSLCQVPEHSVIELLPADYSPIEITSQAMQITVPMLAYDVPHLIEQTTYTQYELESNYGSVLARLMSRGRVLPTRYVYEGDVLGSLPNGKGTYKYAEDDRICVGSWVDGQMQGQGEITWPNGKRVQGHFESNRPVGECTVEWKDGRLYQGTLSDAYELSDLGIMQVSKRNRKAVLAKFLDSLNPRKLLEMDERQQPTEVSPRYFYIGHFKHDMKQGYGVVIALKSAYEGDWERNLFHGHGTSYYELADYDREGHVSTKTYYYSGSWVEGTMHGYGISNSYQGLRRSGVKSGVGADLHYTGDFKNDKYDGYGVLTDEGGQYQGEWREGLKDGFGTFKLQSGDEYEGSYSLNRRSGYGVMRYVSGDRYEGNWSKDAYHGEGTLYSKDGRVYAGWYSEGRGSSYGHFTTPDRHIYQGELSCGRFHGNGRLFYADLTLRYDGSWDKGNKSGFGVETLRSGKRYEGHWYKDKYHGNGRLVSAGQDYVGSWAAGKKHGEGVWKHNGDVYIGSWCHNKMQGSGKYTWLNGDSYEGAWSQDKRSGYGTKRYHTGEVYEGNWIDDQRQGDGSLTRTNGSVLTGTWRSDKFYSN
jgi:hypothetical protein